MAKKHQGREITATIQAPDEQDLAMMITELQDYAMETGMEPIEILSKGPDPGGGYRAVIVAHNWNPLSWLTERGYRAYYGAKSAMQVGQAKAEAKHEIGVEAALPRAPEEEQRSHEFEGEKRKRKYLARLAKLKAQTASAERRQELSAEIKRARLEVTGKERVKTEEELADEEEKQKRERRLRKYRAVVPVETAPVKAPEDLNRFIFS